MIGSMFNRVLARCLAEALPGGDGSVSGCKDVGAFLSRARAAALALMILLPLSGYAQATPPKPDFSGRWHMLKDKSAFAGFKSPDIVTRTVEQRGVIMNVHTVETLGAKTSIADVSYSVDGTPTQNVVNGREAESKTYWDGSTLVVRTSMKTSSGDQELIEDRWSLSDDGQILTTASHIETDKGEVDMTLVCKRQQAEQ